MLYDSFGNLVRDTNPYVRVPLGFAGGLHDWDTGLVRFGWRDYDPETGRFTAPDPIGSAGGDPDRYGYCLDDPINGVDPMGLFGMALPASVPPPLPVPTSPSLPDNQVLADQLWRLGKKNEQRLEQTWEEIKPKLQGPMRPYDHNVDYNPSHHNPNVEIQGKPEPIWMKGGKRGQERSLGGNDEMC
ncbi:MAG: RHS repeat-associated core domain-containing protein [Desulfovibrio sp.]